MKILILFIVVFININLIAQDNIIQIDGSEIKAKVIEIDPTFIKYKRFDNLNGPNYSIYKSQVFMIQYENGTRDRFNTCSHQTSQYNIIQRPDTFKLPDSLIIKNGIYLAGNGMFAFNPKILTGPNIYSSNSYILHSFIGSGIEASAIFYFIPKKMPKHFGFGLNFMFANIGVNNSLDIFPYTSSVGPQITLRSSKATLIDLYCKPGLSVIKLYNNDYFHPEFIMDVGVNLRIKSFVLGTSAVFYPNQPDYSQIRVKLGAFILTKKQKNER